MIGRAGSFRHARWSAQDLGLMLARASLRGAVKARTQAWATNCTPVTKESGKHRVNTG